MYVYVQEKKIIKAKITIPRWLYIPKKRFSNSSPRRNFFYSMMMKVLKWVNEMYFMRTERQFLILICHTTYHLPLFLQHSLLSLSKRKLHLISCLSRSTVWLLAEFLPDTFLQQRREKKNFSSKCFVVQSAWLLENTFGWCFKKHLV